MKVLTAAPPCPFPPFDVLARLLWKAVSRGPFLLFPGMTSGTPRAEPSSTAGLPPARAPPSATEEGHHGALRARGHRAAGHLAATGRSPQRHPQGPHRARRRLRRQDRVLGSAQPDLPDQEEPQGSLF